MFANKTFGQDTIRIEKKPEVILKSWWPEFKEYPELEMGIEKILFTMIPEFSQLSIRNNDVNLVNPSNVVSISETDKKNQFLVKVSDSLEGLSKDFVEFEIWFDLEGKTILLKKNFGWVNVRNEYSTRDDRILIQTIKLQIKR
jgi:hypothetical protein